MLKDFDPHSNIGSPISKLIPADEADAYDEAHEADMRQLRREQLAAEFSPEEIAEMRAEADAHDEAHADDDWDLYDDDWDLDGEERFEDTEYASDLGGGNNPVSE